jgi:threonine dehydrogenase-like Zn-dependent dehydrogenase
MSASRALRISAARSIAIEQLPVLPPLPGQVRVRLEGCGVCASNLPVWEGKPWFTYPREPGSPGHEGWGTIDAVGCEVQGFNAGERVALLSERAYAEHDFAGPEALVRIPAQLAGQPFPGEPLACAMNIFRRSEISAGQDVAIVGVGFLGAVLTLLCVRAGARVVALSRRSFALQTAERFGAAKLVSLQESGRALREARNGECGDGFPRVIECVGSQFSLDVASELTGTRGRLVIAGYHQEGERRVDIQKWNWRGLDIVNAHERDPAEYRRGMQEAIDLLVNAELDTTALFTHRFALEEASAAFEMLARRPDGFLKALLVYE